MTIAISHGPSRTRQRVAQISSILALVCTGLFLCAFALQMIETTTQEIYDAPLILFVGMMFTFLPLLTCTVVAISCVGFRRSRLALCSLAAYFAVPALIGLILFIVERVSKLT